MNDTLPPAPARSVPGLGDRILKIRVFVIVPQPFVRVYDITTVPGAIAVINPEPATIVARAGLALVHVPPGWLAASVCVGAVVGDIVPAPTMADAVGRGITVACAKRLQLFVHV